MKPSSDFDHQAAFASRLLALTLPACAALAVALHTLAPLALMGPPALTLLVHRLRRFAAASVLPNLLTALRVMLTAALALYVRELWLQAALVVLVFVIDGLDGLLARRLHATSAQGAHFDMEADGYFVLVVCALLTERVGAWVLLGGLLRYAFVLATWLVPSRGEAPRSQLARYAFAASLAGYVSALLVPAPLAPWAALLGTLVLVASFGRSFWWSFRPELYET
ncbi:MAG: CDP-alcohol phosphatidyltransferase family protein [Polyangiales bacterium]